ncbi:MAG: hypothetical protein LBT60_04940 [Oscillospiraceae bacterium]|jgi:hypothetical protein|nr:hypothetical protein [Oscillospiraceae bacterium]
MNAATALFREALRTCGGPVDLIGPGGAVAVTAALQPASLSPTGPDTHHPAPPGWVNRARYLYIGPPDHPLADITHIRQGEQTFAVLRAETWRIGDTPHHIWALLEAIPGANP